MKYKPNESTLAKIWGRAGENAVFPVPPSIHNPPLDCAPAARRTPRRCPTPSRGSRWAAGPPATVLEPQSLTTVIGTARAHQAAARVPRLLRGIGPHRRRIPEVGIRVVPATEVGRQQLVHQHEVRPHPARRPSCGADAKAALGPTSAQRGWPPGTPSPAEGSSACYSERSARYKLSLRSSSVRVSVSCPI